MNSHPDTRRLRHLRGEIDFQRDQLLKKLHAADDHAALGDIFRALHSMLYPKPVTTKGNPATPGRGWRILRETDGSSTTCRREEVSSC
jgi:hypothetical protein